MCGRYTLTKPLKNIVIHDSPVDAKTGHKPRYNIAPSQSAPVVICVKDALELHAMRWGLVPSWSRDKSSGSGLINARSETVHEKPSFRSSFKSKRCLVPADGYIEWEKTANGKTPHYIQLPGEEIFSFAGLWSEFQEGQEQVHTFSILTAPASPQVRPLHHRMPVILSRDQSRPWLDPNANAEELKDILASNFTGALESRKISRKINSPANDFQDCLLPELEE